MAAERKPKSGKPKKSNIKQPRLLTFEDYAQLTPLENTYNELHNGRIVRIPNAAETHQTLALKLTQKLGNFIVKNKLGKLLSPPISVVLTPQDALLPDIFFVTNERLSIIDKHVKGAPDFVVEIGRTEKQMSYRKHVFETHGVLEYWLINISKHTITQYENIDDELVLKEKISIEGSLASVAIEGFTVAARDIFG